jgi:hypothetical protein
MNHVGVQMALGTSAPRGLAGGAAFDDVIPHAPPRHEARMRALQHVVALGQQHQAPAARGPGLQGLDARALPQRPVREIGVAEDDLFPALLRRGKQGAAQHRIESLAAVETTVGQKRTLLRRMCSLGMKPT